MREMDSQIQGSQSKTICLIIWSTQNIYITYKNKTEIFRGLFIIYKINK